MTLVPGWGDDLEFSTPERFACVVESVPDQLALAGPGGVSLSYRELHNETLRLSSEILNLVGPGPGHVGLLADLSVEAVVGMLGILAAGKSYVPLDPSEPPFAAANKLENALGELVLAPSRWRESAQRLFRHGGSVLSLELGTGRQVPMPQLRVGPDEMFNLIYTSGSTGAPKGVIQTHRNVMFDTAASASIYRTDPNDRYGLIVPLSFGASVSDVMGALLNGAELHVLDLRQAGLDSMAAWMRSQRITVTHMVPTVFRRWMAALSTDDQYPDMRLIKAGGESLLRRDFEAFSLHFSDTCILRNGLGTTETYLIAVNLLRPGDTPEQNILPVGTAAPGRAFSVVDSGGVPLPEGEVGQIAVTSRYLSPGYWRNEEATARAYLSGAGRGGERTYLTGDLGRILPGGSLHHLGRVDEMFKIRGQRVDPAEVETVLLEHPGVAEAAVAPHTAADGENRLVAYVVADGDPPSAGSLRALLSGRLPPHMIPTAFVALTELPILRFGKVDRRSLPPPGDTQISAGVEYLAARNSIEEAIVRLGAGLLGLERIGVNDDLFDLGVDSLVATQLVGRINQEVGAELTVDAVFEAPTAAGLAVRIGREPDSTQPTDLESILQELEALDEEQARSRLGSAG